MEWLDPHCAQLKISLRNPWDLKVQNVLAHNEVYDANPPPNVGKRRPGQNTHILTFLTSSSVDDKKLSSAVTLPEQT